MTISSLQDVFLDTYSLMTKIKFHCKHANNMLKMHVEQKPKNYEVWLQNLNSTELSCLNYFESSIKLYVI